MLLRSLCTFVFAARDTSRSGAIAMIGRRCNRFIISSHEIQQVQKPPFALGFG
ncbi:hypothetical protein [Nostoc sp. FACHB-892]|uniref:hypothetical protein n=1 Tax=Nostoc sp. FACHB-892 TaxID=2692843 RepID=UPI001689E39E|nr:hypothetical protein [Nostoc sp. FACHB-892]